MELQQIGIFIFANFFICPSIQLLFNTRHLETFSITICYILRFPLTLFSHNDLTPFVRHTQSTFTLSRQRCIFYVFRAATPARYVRLQPATVVSRCRPPQNRFISLPLTVESVRCLGWFGNNPSACLAYTRTHFLFRYYHSNYLRWVRYHITDITKWQALPVSNNNFRKLLISRIV